MKVSTKLATAPLKAIPATAMAKALDKAKKAEPAIVARKDDEVVALITEAVTLAGTMVAKCRAAAKLASAQFNPEKTPHQNVEAVVGMYAETFAGDHNVKAIFKDCLWLLAAKAAPVTIVTKSKSGDTEQHLKAVDAVDLPKHALRDAAKQVREQAGAGRMAGGGSKPKGAVASPTNPTRASKVFVPEAGPVVASDAASVWLDNLAAFLGDPAMIPRIKAVCSEHGFALSKARAKK